MERQSTSKLFRALIAVVAFFVLCTSAILFASCGSDPLECKHPNLAEGKVVNITEATCSTNGSVTYTCPDCDADVTVVVTIASGEHNFVDGVCSVCNAKAGATGGLSMAEIKETLTSVLGKLDSVASSAAVEELKTNIMKALQDPDGSIPNINAKLEELMNSLGDLGNLDIELTAEGSVTLADAIKAIYDRVNKLCVDLESVCNSEEFKGGIKDLFFGEAQGEVKAHPHNWVLVLKDGAKYNCTSENKYTWECSICHTTKPGEVTVQATGHVTEFKSGVTDAAHHYDATCVSGMRVEGHCAVCGEWTGEWTEVGKPTYQHHYVLEDNSATTGRGGACEVGKKVYHCETCGGAYVEETTSPTTQHNYYFQLDENGKKTPLTEAGKKQILEQFYGKSTDLSDEQINVALESHLNVVYNTNPSCVDPGLRVVECMECGVRYSYSFGEPKGHTFQVMNPGDDPTCTMDGFAAYFYCTDCGYYFMFDELETVRDGLLTNGYGKFDNLKKVWSNGKTPVPEYESIKYSRNYMRLNGEILWDDPAVAAQEDAQDPAPTTSKLLDRTKAYDVASAKKPALGHHYSVVYTNNFKCVTEHQYILVCDRCFEGGKDKWTSIEKRDDGTYYLKNLPTDNTLTTTIEGLVKSVAKAATRDYEDSTVETEPTVKTDLNLEWDALYSTTAPATSAEIAAWLYNHGYLNRDSLDTDEYFADEDAAVAALGSKSPEELKAYYTLYNVIGVYVPEDEETGADAHYDATVFADPVTGHTFNDFFVTVVGGCTMYERHVYFCSVCGQSTGNPPAEAGKPTGAPVIVTPNTDAYVAGYTAAVPEDYKTDLEKAFDAAVAAAEEDEDWQLLYTWLGKFGYLNNYRRTVKVQKVGDDGKLVTTTDGKPVYEDKLPSVTDDMGSILIRWLGEYKEPTIDELKELFTGNNTLEEYAMDTEISEEGTLVPAPLGHTFNAVAFIGEGETCDSPADYVYVCSKCGHKATELDPFTYYDKNSKVNTGLKKINDLTHIVPDSKAFENAVPATRRGDGKDFEVSDLEAQWLALEDTDEQFEWLLAKGYLNGVVDNYFMYGDGDEENTSDANGALAKALEAAQAEDPLARVTTTMYKTARATVYTEDGIKESEKEAIEALAIAFAKTAGFVTGTDKVGDITVYYEKSSSEVTNDDIPKDTAVSANKTIDAAKVTIPESGHLWADGDGNLIDVERDPLCTEFQSKTLTDFLNPNGTTHHMAVWVEAVEGTAEKPAVAAHWAEGKDITAEWNAALEESGDAVLKAFIKNVKAYGVLGACKRNVQKVNAESGELVITTGCPLYSSQENATETTAWGYLSAIDHVTSYEKYTASTKTGYPTGTLVTVDGEHVYYNYNTIEAYKTETTAGAHLDVVDTYSSWTKLQEDLASTVTETKDKATAALNKAAQAAMDADLHNLATLQKIWNSLFVATSWLYPAATSGTAKINWETADKRVANYPLYESVMTGKATETIKVGKEDVVKTYYTGVDVEKVKALFPEDSDVAHLWKGDDTTTSAWRPLGDDIGTDGRKIPSCWVNLYCKWYHAEGNKCTKGYPEVRHAYPTNLDAYGVESHLANCKHIDLCMTCGQPIGRGGEHKLLQVAPGEGNEITVASPQLRNAWIKVLQALYAEKDTATAPADALLAKLKPAITFAADVDFADFDWEHDWAIKKDTCSTGEKGYEIYICSGELEVIANNKTTWNEGVTWTVSTSATATAGNYYVKELDTAAHNYTVTKYYYLNDYYVNGDPVGTKDAEITDFSEFSEIICQVGYYTREFCSNVGQDGKTVCNAVNTATDGKSVAAYQHKPIGHTLAPVENYQSLEETYVSIADKAKLVPPITDQNASMTQVCVVCGMHFDGEWGKTKPTGAGYTDQFNLATAKQIENWNKHAEAWNAEEGHEDDQLWKAEVVHPEDVLNATSVGTGNYTFTEGLSVFKDEKSLTINGAAKTVVTTNSTIVVDDKLTFTKGTGSARAVIEVQNTLAIVGQGPENTVVDMTQIDRLQTNNAANTKSDVTVIFENLTLNLGKDGTTQKFVLGAANNNIVFRNVVVHSETASFGVNANWANGGTITIENSTFISNTVGLGLWNKGFEIVATDSIFYGANAGAFIRSGKATFTNCTFLTDETNGFNNAEWGDSVNAPNDAALIIGNGTEQAAYGDADVTLTNCGFGTCTLSGSGNTATVPASTGWKPCDTTVPAIAAYSSSVNNTKITISDAKTLVNANGAIIRQSGTKKVGDKNVDTLTVVNPTVKATDLGVTKEAQAGAAATLVGSAAMLGGSLTLPKIDDEIKLGEGAFALSASTEAAIDLNGNKVTLGDNGATVAGKLTLTNGTLTGASTFGSDRDVDFAVSGTLELVGMTVTLDKGGILPSDGGKIIIKNSTIVGNSQLLTSNASDHNGKKDKFEIELDNVKFVALVGMAVQINTPESKLTAKNCTFYGGCVGVWVRAGEANFTDCVFVSGGNVYESGVWGSGTCMPRTATAALMVGEGATTAYGAATVTINGNKSDAIRGYYKAGTEGDAVGTVTWDSEKLLLNYADNETDQHLTTVTKRFSVSSNTSATTVTFGSKTIADKFLRKTTVYVDPDTRTAVEGLVKGQTVYYNEAGSKITVQYVSGTSAGKPVYTPIRTTYAVAEGEIENDASATFTEAAKNGGLVSIPKIVENGVQTVKTVPVTEQVEIARDVEIDLNGNKLELTNQLLVKEGGNLTVKGGEVIGSATSLVKTQGEAKLTLDGVTYKSASSAYGLNFNIAGENGTDVDASGAEFNIVNSVIASTGNGGTAIWVHGNLDKAKLNITNSVLIGAETGLQVAGDATVVATNSVFFGKSAAVQVNSGKSTFTGCTFVSAAQANGGSAFGVGSNTYPTAMNAIFVIAAKGGAYNNAVEVNVAGNTFVKATNELKTDATGSFELAVGSVKSGYYYETTGGSTADNIHEISVAVVDAIVEIKLTVNAGCLLEVGMNVFKYNGVAGALVEGTKAAELAARQVKVTGSQLTDKPAQAEPQP